MSAAVNGKLIFLHIPKTGGSTLRKVIDQQYDPNETLRCYYHKQGISLREALEEMMSLSREQAARVKIILGHVGFGIHQYLPWPCSYFTMLRDPVDRVISGYYHILRDNFHPFQSQVKQMSLEEYVSSDWLKSKAVPVNAVNALDNSQTRLLSGCVVNTELSERPDDYGECDGKMLEQAMENLKQFVAVGISERFDQSLMLLKKELWWSSIYYVKANVGWNKTKRTEIPKEVLKSIEKNNEMDLELYNYARQLFVKTLDRQGLLFKTRTDSYRFLNKTFSGARRVTWAIEKKVSQKVSGHQK